MTLTVGNFWAGKEPCWVMQDCAIFVRHKCAAFLHPEKPCWEDDTTQCEAILGIPRSCPNCKVFRLYYTASPS